MCALLDANVRHEFFGINRRTEAGAEFFKWINGDIKGKALTLVVGGQLTKELTRDDDKVLEWLAEAALSAKVFVVSDFQIKEAKKKIDGIALKSNDRHVILLAVASGARLLYSKGKDLHAYFRSPNVIDNPRSRVYSTLKSGSFDDNMRRVLREVRNQCKNATGCSFSSEVPVRTMTIWRCYGFSW